MSDHARDKHKSDARPWRLVRQGIQTEESMSIMIDNDMAASKSKSKTWRQLDTYLKWQAVSAYLSQKQVKKQELYKKAFQSGKMINVEYDSKKGTISCLNYKDL
jgi:hypothetical protein